MGKRSSFPLRLDKWDSSFFNKPIARLHIFGKGKKRLSFYSEIKDFLKRAKDAKVGFVFIRLEYPKPSCKKMLLKAGLKECGEYSNLVHHWQTCFDISPVEGYVIRPYKRQYQEQICEIAKKAFRLSYLYKSRFARRDKVDLYHEIWLKNQIKNKDYLVFVAERLGRIAGFVTMNLKNTKNSARMSLMAVHKKHRGKGLGNFMIRTMLREACLGKKDTHFRTQSDNQFALSIYRKIGCRVLSRENMFFKKV